MKVILILGAAVWQDGPSPALQRRCNHALGLWQSDKTQLLVPCGGLGKHPPTEADMMQSMLTDNGVPNACIIAENRSTTTYENIRNAVTIIGAAQITQLVIVSDLYHLPRAAMVARHFGFRARLSGPSLHGTHTPTLVRNIARELGAIPLYALKLLGHRLRGPN